MDKVVIISVFYNRESSVAASVKSIVDQLEKGYRIYLVDDGSSDNTLQYLREWEREGVSVLTHDNMGFVKSIRKAIESTSSQYIAIHGSGDLSYQGRIAKQARFLDDNLEYGVVGCYSMFDSVLEGKKYEHKMFFDGDAREHLKRSNIFHHGEVMFRRSCYLEVGGYREFFKFAQDYDLWIRMSRITKFYVVPEILYERVIGAEGAVSGSPRKILLQQYCAGFAQHCNNFFIENGFDPLDRYGACYSLVADVNSRRMNRRLFIKSLRFLISGRANDAKYLIVHSANKNDVQGLLYKTFGILVRLFPNLSQKVVAIVSRLYRGI